jgi:hypothetical protein
MELERKIQQAIADSEKRMKEKITVLQDRVDRKVREQAE